MKVPKNLWGTCALCYWKINLPGRCPKINNNPVFPCNGFRIRKLKK
jgi:hypothetical protein